MTHAFEILKCIAFDTCFCAIFFGDNENIIPCSVNLSHMTIHIFHDNDLVNVFLKYTVKNNKTNAIMHKDVSNWFDIEKIGMLWKYLINFIPLICTMLQTVNLNHMFNVEKM